MRSSSLTQYSLHAGLNINLLRLGIQLDTETGHLSYADDFKPLSLTIEVVFVRHGETFGNCGQATHDGKIATEMVAADIKDSNKRIFQGNVDTEINQLTDLGKWQATQAAAQLTDLLLNQGWEPDLILSSPLQRAIDTALPFVNQHQYTKRFSIHGDIREMAFGSWDNQRVCDLEDSNTCHDFYRHQNALVKDCQHDNHQAESFAEVLLRAHLVLSSLDSHHRGKKILMFSHSMFGAACCILFGLSQKIENGNYLAFDGKRSDGTHYTMPNATPFLLNIDPPRQVQARTIRP